jgi:predicted nucleic acid-binding protein
LSRYLLDTTVLIAHLRGDSGVSRLLLDLLADGHRLGICCINVAEVERGLRPAERKRAKELIDRFEYFDTTREAAGRAGRYQAELQRKGRTLHTADAIIAGTARAHGAVLVTDNLGDFPMADLVVRGLPDEPAPGLDG